MAEQTSLTTVQQVEGQKPGLISTMAEQYGVAAGKFLEAVRDQCFPKREGKIIASTEQLLAFLTVAHAYGLNPFTREIYAFLDKFGNVRPVVGVDGWVSLVNRQPKNDGFEFEEKEGSDGKPLTSTCVLWVKGRSHPIKITEYYAECYRETEPWKQMPRRMLRHKSLIQAARYAFGFSGIQDEDEARDAIEVEPIKPPPASIPPVGVESVEQQKKITEFHKLADAAGWNNAQKHMALGKHEGNLDAAIAEVRALVPAPPADALAPKKAKKGQKPSEATTAPSTPEPEKQPEFGF